MDTPRFLSSSEELQAIGIEGNELVVRDYDLMVRRLTGPPVYLSHLVAKDAAVALLKSGFRSTEPSTTES